MVFWTSLTVPCRHDGTLRCRVLRVITKPRGLLRKNAGRSHRAFIKRLNLSPVELQEKIQKIKHSRDYSFLFQDVSRLPIIKPPPSSSLLRQSLLGSNPTCRGRSESTRHGGSLIRGLCSAKNGVKKQGPIPKISRMSQHQDRIINSLPKSSQLGLKKTTHPYLENKVTAGDRTKSVCLKRKQQDSTAAEAKINGGADSLHETQQKSAMTSSLVKEGCLESTRQGLAFAKKKINSDSGSNSSHKSVQKPATPSSTTATHIQGDKMVNGDCNEAGP